MVDGYILTHDQSQNCRLQNTIPNPKPCFRHHKQHSEKAVVEYIEDTGDDKVYCDTLDFEMRNYDSAIDGHPSAESHIAASENLVLMIEKVLNDSFVNSYEEEITDEFTETESAEETTEYYY